MLWHSARCGHRREAKPSAFIEKAIRAPNLYLYMFTIAVVIYSTLEVWEKPQSCVSMIRAYNTNFSRDDVLSDYGLRVAAAKAKFLRALEAVDL